MLDVSQLADEFNFEVRAGHQGLHKEITDYSLKRPSAELMGYLTYLTPQRIQVYGRTELGLLHELAIRGLDNNNLDQVLVADVPCAIVTNGLAIPPEIIDLANARNIPILSSKRSTTQLFYLFELVFGRLLLRHR